MIGTLYDHMKRPPVDRRRNVVFVLVVVTVSVGSLAIVQAGASQTTTATTDDACTYDSYSPPELAFAWTESYTDALDNGSERDWSGGRIVHVGADGECSLLVDDDHSESLTAETINGTQGVLTGTVDLGTNGSVRFTATGASSGDTTTEAIDPNVTGELNGLAISNPGPDYETDVVLEAGVRSETVSLDSGRFFEIALRLDNGTAKVAVWDAEGSWDSEWDLTVENVTAEEDWRVGLDGRAFLDGIAIGTAEAGESETETPAPEDGTDEDGLLGPENGPDFDDRNTDPDAERDTAGQIIVGFLMSIGGAVVYWYARALTRFSEQIDAIGSTTDPAEVEPAGWNVFLTKAFAAFFVLFGLFWAGAPILLS